MRHPLSESNDKSKPVSKPETDFKPDTKLEDELSPDASLKEAYETLTPRFWQCTMNLRKQDKISQVELTHTRDIIHDFFDKIWPGVIANYNPEKGPLIPFAYVSFRNHANSYFKKLRRQKDKFIDTEGAVETAIDHTKTGSTTNTKKGLTIHDRDIFKKAFDRLDPEDQDCLLRYFDSLSFREISKQDNISRHKAGQKVENAFAKLLMDIEKPDSIDTKDWEISRPILTNHYSIKQAAHHFGKNSNAIRQAHKRTMNAIRELVKPIKK